MTQREIEPATMSQSLLLQLINDVSEIGGRLGTLQGQAGEIIREQHRAAEGRKEIYAKINRIPAIEAELERISPLVDGHEKKSNRAEGAVSAGRALLAAGGGLVGGAITLAVKWLLDGGQPPHH